MHGVVREIVKNMCDPYDGSACRVRIRTDGHTVGVSGSGDEVVKNPP